MRSASKFLSVNATASRALFLIFANIFGFGDCIVFSDKFPVVVCKVTENKIKLLKNVKSAVQDNHQLSWRSGIVPTYKASNPQYHPWGPTVAYFQNVYISVYTPYVTICGM